MLAIAEPIRYVFYRILSWKLRDPRETTPVLVAALSTALLLFFNGLTAMMLANGLAGRPLLPTLPGTRAEQCGVFALILIAFTYIVRRAWVEQGRYSELVREFESINGREHRVRATLFWSYVAASIILPIGLAIFWPQNGS